MSDGVCDYCSANMNGDECSNPNCGTNIFTSCEKDRRIAVLESKRTALEEALTPSAETKAAYWGEDDTTTDWTLIKNIMRHIRRRAWLNKEKDDG